MQTLSREITDILADNLVGLYLFGSLTYGDFDPQSSDIDLVAILNQPASQPQLALLEQMHRQVEMKYPTWAERIECSYTPREMLKNILPPLEPRPYVGEGTFYPEAEYGNEWIINLYLMREHGLALIGPAFQELVDPIPIIEVEKACIRDLFREWEPKMADPAWLANSHYQSYVVLNLCRILYTVLAHATGSKKVSARWVKSNFGQWRDLIETAEKWRYGMEMNRQAETVAFIQFAIDQIKQTPLYAQLS
ncbi:MAG: DUF4111 domain-containing protein [Anaerolineae bacterium]|nr:DUF4111 domain-containing protein [Anaerolineae bacterium]